MIEYRVVLTKANNYYVEFNDTLIRAEWLRTEGTYKDEVEAIKDAKHYAKEWIIEKDLDHEIQKICWRHDE